MIANVDSLLPAQINLNIFPASVTFVPQTFVTAGGVQFSLESPAVIHLRGMDLEQAIAITYTTLQYLSNLSKGGVNEGKKQG